MSYYKLPTVLLQSAVQCHSDKVQFVEKHCPCRWTCEPRYALLNKLHSASINQTQLGACTPAMPSHRMQQCWLSVICIPGQMELTSIIIGLATQKVRCFIAIPKGMFYSNICSLWLYHMCEFRYCTGTFDCSCVHVVQGQTKKGKGQNSLDNSCDFQCRKLVKKT